MLTSYEHSPTSAKFLQLVTSHMLSPIIFLPTRPASNSLLDNIFVSWPGHLKSYVT
jgi:hypothetical protein